MMQINENSLISFLFPGYDKYLSWAKKIDDNESIRFPELLHQKALHECEINRRFNMVMRSLTYLRKFCFYH